MEITVLMIFLLTKEIYFNIIETMFNSEGLKEEVPVL